ncbi:MAG: RsmB/NOP family class I SAM-dependent RNA methyltransferase, partial [Acidobacteria bacterium]|nr:RsmB/NOP family class I SAM-dependent RNA methyltransferase [Acidobacteriota bacterium]
HVLGAEAGERVLDVCAAPGSKTTHIAALTPGIELLVAGDLYGHRLRTVLESARRTGADGRIHALVHDAVEALPFAAQSFERVLVDAPCSGTGTLRRNPEIRWRISSEDMIELSERQRRILSNAARTVRPKGRLVYSTCSVETEENEAVVAAFLQEQPEFRQVAVQAPPRLMSEDGVAARIWPQRDGADGFYLAAFERIA